MQTGKTGCAFITFPGTWANLTVEATKQDEFCIK